MIDNNCAYCVEGDLVAKFGIKICELDTCKVYLFKEQSHRGRVIACLLYTSLPQNNGQEAVCGLCL